MIAIDKNNKKAQRVIDQAAAWDFKSIEAYAHDSRKLIDTTGAAGNHAISVIMVMIECHYHDYIYRYILTISSGRGDAVI